MYKNKYKVIFSDINRRIVRELVGIDHNTGSNIFYTYQGVSIFQSRTHDVAATIGMMALSDAVRLAIPMGAIAQKIPELVNAGLLHLAMMPDLWRFVGCEKSAVELQAAIANDSNQMRRREIEALLGISERRSSRFLFLNRHLVLTTGNSHSNSSLEANQGLSMVFDAVGYANELRARCPGVLFTIETENQ